MSAALAAAVKERPILFSAPMVRAILEGRKTQTRRVANVRGADRVRFIEHGKLIPPRPGDAGFTGWVAEIDKLGGERGLHLPLICPYGVPGYRLWVRETWIPVRHGSYEPLERREKPRSMYEAATCYAADPVNGYGECWDSYEGKWRPSIHMPRWASRLTLEVVNVRVERVQDISEEDAKAEGVEPKQSVTPGNSFTRPYRATYAQLWESINAKRGYGWDKNPWVWVIKFKQVTGAL